ncbi:unnamed protein product [Rotaria sp. Silwood2]|nr:unnamed protein product [Rotaria sp. Silwood2]CAF3174603.1 unnamed protein product [Rotaria sp. Silwood2]CAF4244432.1 unnamed protein product [Rotaria sp. Silwood2]CAF4442410.1 unnamed protein product [Rotaria sp. Silwood2]
MQSFIKTTFEDVSTKRECTTKSKQIACPLSKYGCTSELLYDELPEHYSSSIHLEKLFKAIEIFVQELHSKPFYDNFQCDLEKDYYSEILPSINILAEGISCLHDDNVQIHNNFVQVLSKIVEQQKQIEKVKNSIEETSQMLYVADMNNKILQTQVETLKQTISDCSSTSSNDGSYVWKISNVSEKLADAIADRQTSIYSPPLYSSSTGYKMCMRLYMNGDGQARGTHLSLFFVLMRGDYDSILTWPFSYKVIFCLYDQTGSQRHIIDSFRPDIKSNSFQRPRSAMNIASGIPKFLPLSIIQPANNPYVRDDCMFIRCIVDFESMPKMCIPYALNLNLGLPMSIREKAIQAESEKLRSPSSLSTVTRCTESSTKIDHLTVKT